MYALSTTVQNKTKSTSQRVSKNQSQGFLNLNVSPVQFLKTRHTSPAINTWRAPNPDGREVPMQFKKVKNGLQGTLYTGNEKIVTQMFWGKAIATLPGIAVVVEGVLSIVAAGALATNPWIMWPVLSLGISKFFRGMIMVGNALVDGDNNPNWKKNLTKITNGLRAFEAAAGTVALVGGTITTDEAKRKAGVIITGSIFALLKIIRSVSHFFEGNSYVHKMVNQTIEILEGIVVAVGAGFADGSAAAGLAGAIGASKIIRGAVAGSKLTYDKNHPAPTPTAVVHVAPANSIDTDATEHV